MFILSHVRHICILRLSIIGFSAIPIYTCRLSICKYAQLILCQQEKRTNALPECSFEATQAGCGINGKCRKQLAKIISVDKNVLSCISYHSKIWLVREMFGVNIFVMFPDVLCDHFGTRLFRRAMVDPYKRIIQIHGILYVHPKN